MRLVQVSKEQKNNCLSNTLFPKKAPSPTLPHGSTSSPNHGEGSFWNENSENRFFMNILSKFAEFKVPSCGGDLGEAVISL